MANKIKILLIDDEKGFTDMLSLNLESTGNFHVRVENKAENALYTASLFQPDLIVLDIIMPRRDGKKLAREFRSNEDLKNVPIIFLTATITKDQLDQEAGTIEGCPFVSKPSNFSELLKAIEINLKK
ncbi:MAG: response regulator [Candidatus Omnitrophica bacterium]|nr:response regulator [Candidatus Omnitrophota bacterium]